MREVWLRANRRIVLANMLVPGLLCIAGALIGSQIFGWPQSTWLRGLGLIVCDVSLLWLLSLLWQLSRPRLAREDGELLIYLRHGAPIRVPLEVVECFLMGYASSFVKGPVAERSHATTIVVRLAERAREWQHVDVEPSLGSWCDGHVVLRGTWCEPLSLDVVNRLNRRLAEVQRSTTAQAAS